MEQPSFDLWQGNCIELIQKIDTPINMVFADPPYFLSNGGLSIQSGQIVSVNKGDWDEFEGHDKANEFTYEWINAIKEKLDDTGTIWISGTYHNIFSVGQIIQELGFKILNVVTWQKTNPPPNFSCRFFTHSTEFIIWARKGKKAHCYNYDLMKALNGNKQMKDVWSLPAIAKWEKFCGKHPTQKPLPLLMMIVLASTKKGDLVVDPFSGSSTTGIAAYLAQRNYIGIEKEQEFIDLSMCRLNQIKDSESDRAKFIAHFERLLNKSPEKSEHVSFEEMINGDYQKT